MSISDSGLLLINGSGLETLVGQFQEENENIICVKGGKQMLIYKDPQQLPKNLRFWKTSKVNPTGVTEYLFRDGNTVYTFFNDQVYNWIIGGRSGALTLPASSKKDVTLEAPILNMDDVEASLDYLSSEWTVAEDASSVKRHVFKIREPPSDKKHPTSTVVDEDDSSSSDYNKDDMTGKTIDIDFYDLPKSGHMQELALYKKK